MQGTCSIDGCGRPARSLGLCSTHYSRLWKFGDPNRERSRPDPICTIEGCTREHAAKGLCQLHYNRKINNRDMTVPLKEILPRHSPLVTKYGTMHARIKLARGRAKDHACADCGFPARDWAYDLLDPDEVTDGDQVFSRKLEHYVPLCRPCHLYLDEERFRSPGRNRRWARPRNPETKRA